MSGKRAQVREWIVLGPTKNAMRVRIRLEGIPDGVRWIIRGSIEGMPGTDFEFSVLAADEDEAMEKAARMVKVTLKP